jgi:long-chain acyl-CoA synthetase
VPARQTLLDFFDDFASSDAELVVDDDGRRVRRFTARAIALSARAFAARLRREGVARREAAIVWSENRAEWLVALWGCLLEGVVVVPIDPSASIGFVERVAEKVGARLLLLGDQPRIPEGWHAPVARRWPIAALLDAGASLAAVDRPAIARDDVAEIIFTSGATGDPRGVVITHRNILANLVPLEREIRKYRRYVRLVSPVRLLELLPLSHMFGQAMAAFVPPMLEGTAVFARVGAPGEIARQIRARRISVLVAVPKVLEVLRDYVARNLPEAAHPEAARGPRLAAPLVAWWRYRRVHRLFGWKFWAFVVGAAPLDPELETYWTRLGFAVVQGYGLTETAPIVALNHPFRPRRGTVGRPLPGVEVRIAEDGEILVRGENVAAGYFGDPAATAEAFRDGWLHTGDIGEIDETGRLRIRGRKKEMIVTPEGLNVFPEDVERALDRQPGVRESAVVERDGRPHAVLVIAPGADPAEIVRRANRELEEHQRIRGYSVWPEPSLPRTPSTRKLRRAEIRRRLEGAAPPTAPAPSERAADIVARFAPGRAIDSSTTLDELGLSSLERVQLLLALEEASNAAIDEAAFARAVTVGDLEALLGEAAGATPPVAAPAIATATTAAGRGAPTWDFPVWNRTRAARAVRRIAQAALIVPLTRAFAWLRVEGREALAGLEGPFVLAANHRSHFDTPVLLAALPPRLRGRIAPAMSKEFFQAHFAPAPDTPTTTRWLTSLGYALAALCFNAFPLPQREAGAREALRYMADLAAEGWSLLIFPEGRHVREPGVGRFQPGVGLVASQLGLPVVPVWIEGTDRVLPPGARMARPARVTIRFGAPIRPGGEDYLTLTRRIEEAVRALAAASSGAGGAAVGMAQCW